MKVSVSTKHVKLRVILFAVFFVMAVVAFTLGFVNMGKKSAGYETITAEADPDALTANSGLTFKYYFDGSSNEIKREIKAVTAVYGPLCNSSFKELDCRNTYGGSVSIGALNANSGSIVSVSPRLYAILKDAYARTLEGCGFNMFAGDLYSEWESILILADPEEFDPSVNSYQASRIRDIARMVNDLGNFSLEFLDDELCQVRFSVSDSYRAFCAEYEIESFPLSLNMLEEAYRLSYIVSGLEEAGMVLGYLVTDTGLAVCPADRGSLDYEMYTLEDGEPVSYAAISMEGVFNGASFTAFPYGSPYGYCLDADGRTLYRHRYFNVLTGAFSDVLLNMSILSPGTGIVDNACLLLTFNSLGSASEVASLAAQLEKQGVIVSYVLQDDVR